MRHHTKVNSTDWLYNHATVYKCQSLEVGSYPQQTLVFLVCVLLFPFKTCVCGCANVLPCLTLFLLPGNPTASDQDEYTHCVCLYISFHVIFYKIILTRVRCFCVSVYVVAIAGLASETSPKPPSRGMLSLSVGSIVKGQQSTTVYHEWDQQTVEVRNFKPSTVAETFARCFGCKDHCPCGGEVEHVDVSDQSRGTVYVKFKKLGGKHKISATTKAIAFIRNTISCMHACMYVCACGIYIYICICVRVCELAGGLVGR